MKGESMTTETTPADPFARLDATRLRHLLATAAAGRVPAMHAAEIQSLAQETIDARTALSLYTERGIVLSPSDCDAVQAFAEGQGLNRDEGAAMLLRLVLHALSVSP